MLKINISAQHTNNPRVQEALMHLLHAINSELSDSSHLIDLSSFASKRSKQITVKVATSEVDAWLSFLNPTQQAFVKTLRQHNMLSLDESAKLLGIEPSDKNLKKHVNGSVGSIIRWSKKHYLKNIYKGLVTQDELNSIKLLPPWYCEHSNYYWSPKEDL